MGNFLKKLSLPKIFSKKQIVFLFLLFLIFALFFPTSFTRAQWWGPLVKPFEVGIGLLLQLTLLMAEAVLLIGIAFLGWIVGWTTSGGLSLTNPTNNKIIETGWTLIRDFANIGFILGLVYIGLATALGIVGFQTKKIFGWLLLMALVINFTPLICGIIVDASNLVGKFFMEGMANWSTLKDVFSIHGGALMRMLSGPPSIQPILIFLSLIAFGFVAGFTLFIFALLLLVRVVAIQILVILSPLAFLAYIFPKTRSYFSTWWNQFLQWSFVGAIGGFFLYLARVALYQAKTTNLYRIPTPDDPTGGVLGSLAPFAVVIIFLIIGLYITLQTSAMGANYVIGAAKTVGKKIPKGVGWVNKKAGAAVAGGVRGAGEGLAEGWKAGKGLGKITGALKEGVRWERIKKAPKEGFKGAFTREGREKGRETTEKFLEWARVVRPGFHEEQRRKRWKLDDEVKRLDKLPTNRLEQIIKRLGLRDADVRAKVAATEILGKRHEFKLETPEKERNVIRQAQSFGANLSELVKGRPDLAPIVKSGKVQELKGKGLSEKEANSQVIKEILEVMSPKQFTERIQPVAMKPEVFLWVSVPQIGNLGTRGTLEQRKKFTEVSISPELHRYQQSLQLQGKLAEVNKIQQNRTEIAYDPNFKGII